MAVKRRLSGYSGMRVDLPHIRSIESSVSYDFDSVLRGIIVGSNPYLIRGFDIIIPNAAINASALVVEVSDSAVLHGSSGESGTILTVATGTADDTLNSSNSRVVGAFQNGVPNYVSLSYKRSTDPATADQTAGWSEAQKSEYKRTVPIGRVLDYQYIITTSGFSTNLPLYVIGVSPTGAVQYITKGANGLFRLGKGGSVPDPYSSYSFGSLANSQSPGTPRREWLNENTSVASNPVTAMPGDDPNAFRFGDWSIQTLKEWMDAIMTRIKETTGSLFWYTNSGLSEGSPNINDLYFDAVNSVLTGNGYMAYNLILEATQLADGDGGFQSQFTDPTILPGDSYIEGVTSGNKATLSSFNGTQLVVNSLLKSTFLYDEALWNRRIFRPLLSDWSLDDSVVAPDRLAVLSRLPAGAGPTETVTTWTYSGRLITVNTSGNHGYSAGDYIAVSGLTTDLQTVPGGVFRVNNELSLTSFTFNTALIPSGTPAATGTTQVSSGVRHPYMPRFDVSAWAYSVTTITLTVPGHTIVDGDIINVWGLTSTTNPPNGRFTAIVNPDRTITFTAPATPTGTAGIVSGTSFLSPDSHTFTLTVKGAGPDLYNVDNLVATAYSDTQLYYRMGPDSLSSQVSASGAIEFDGVVAVSTVANPAKVASISNSGSPNYVYTVTTTVPHGYISTVGPIDHTIFGDPAISPYIRTYQSVGLVLVSPTVYEIHPILPNGTIIAPPPSSYTNTGNADAVYVRFPDNPYPGPIQWSSDLIIKGIIGDRYFKIPQTATANGTSLANKFNINGQTGTAFLQEGEVAFIKLLRNLSVSAGATFTTIGGDTITGSAPVDPSGNPLIAGDFVKFEGEGENRWIRIKTVLGNTITLESNNGQPPTTVQRPAHTGRLEVSKTQYNTVTVAPHYLVENSPDIYWLAVRRDNGSLKSKVYLKALELEAGEVREINDNEPTNLLVYTGAGNEAAINPNYTNIDQSGPYQRTETLTVGPNLEDKDVLTRTLSFLSGPDLGFQAEDKLVYTDVSNIQTTLTVNYLLSSKTAIFKEDISPVPVGSSIAYYRSNYKINDTDNLTLAQRKTNREQAKVNTALERPIYDESVYVQQINLLGTDLIRSGSFIYQGTQTNPTALAWVLHGTDTVNETLEGSPQTMPGLLVGANSILVHIYSGTWLDGSTISQNGVTGDRTINNTSNPAFNAPALVGGVSGIKLVLPPNRRTQVVGSSYIVFPSHASYKASLTPELAGEELLVIANDSIRQAELDYSEIYGGPKGMIQVLRSMPPNTRIRFRIMAAYGSALAKISGGVNLQVAYDGGRIVTTGSSLPIKINAGGGVNDFGIDLTGSMKIAGGGTGGIFGDSDQSFNIGDATRKPKEVWAGSDFIKQHAGYTGSEWKRTTASGVSMGPSAASLASTSITVLSGFTGRIKMNVSARRTDGPLGNASFTIEGAFYNAGAGVLSSGSPTTTFLGSAGNGNVFAVAFGISGNDVLLVVYGDVGSTVQWVIGIDSQQISDSV